jgi:hypothetical protein
MPRFNRLVTLVAVLALVGACGEGGSTDGAVSLDAPADDVVLRVIVGDEVAADWTLADLEDSFSFAEVEIDGDIQDGPRLLDVLAASGVEEWRTAEVIGMGEGRTFEVGLDISRVDADEEWVLDVTNRGTLKLAAETLARNEWVRDVGEIRIP